MGAVGTPQQPFDLVITGGRHFDAASATWRAADIGIVDGVVTALQERLDPAAASLSADVGGAMVLPGLVDLHVHAYPGATFWGIEIDEVSLGSGVTTIVDAGSAGPYNFAGLAKRLRTSRVRGLAYLNIAPGGLATPHGELMAAGAANVEQAVLVARSHPDLIVGFKLRASPNTVGQNAAETLAAVRRAADETGLKVMVHVSDAPPSLSMVLDHLRDGDVLTHCFTPYDNCVIGNDGRPRPEVVKALARGVLLDLGHGSGSFSFPAAEAWVRSGEKLPVISTDIHKRSVLGPVFNMNTVMTKMLAAGAAITDVLRAVTSAPSSALGLESSVAVGSAADIAVLDLEERPLTVWDSRGVEREAQQRVRCLLTVRGSEVDYVDPGVRLVGA